MGLGGKGGDFVGVHLRDQLGWVAGDVEGMQHQSVSKMGDAPVVGHTGGPNGAVNDVPEAQQVLGKVGAILASDPGNEGDLAHDLLSFLACARNPVEDTDGQLLTLFALAASIKGANFLELGVRHARSTLPLLWAAKLSEGYLTSVDKIDPAFSPPESLAFYWRFVKQDALDFLRSRNERFDLVFVDDWHGYSHVKAELAELDRLVGPGSLILLHDTMHGHTEPFYNVDLSIKDGQWESGGPARAMMELDPLRWEWATLPWWHGLSIIRKKHSKLYYPR